MLALTGQRGDWCTRSDSNTDWQLIGEPSSTLANWRERTYPAGVSAVSSVAGRTGAVTLSKSDVGLTNVDNTTDAGKPVSTAQQAALNAKANTASPTFTGTVGGITKAMVGLGNVDNTSDANKPISTAQAAVNAAKADLDGSGKVPQAQIPAVALTEFLGAVGSQAAMLALAGQRGDWCARTDLGTDWQLVSEPASTLANWREHTYPASAVTSVAGRTGAVTLSKADVGLGNVDNTSDANKPVSTAQQAALDLKASTAALTAAQLVAINAQTAAYTLALTDQNKAVEVTAAAGVTVTIPPNSAVAFPAGAIVEVAQLGAGQVTIAAGAGVTLLAPVGGTVLTRTQNSTLSLRKRASDVWIVSGDMQ